MLIWTIDTGVVGECDAKDLRKVLEAARDHYLTTQVAAAGNAHKHAASRDVVDHEATAAAITAARESAKALVPTIKAMMDQGIGMACSGADFLGGNVTATVSGHCDERHPSGIDQRLQVSVDKSPY